MPPRKRRRTSNAERMHSPDDQQQQQDEKNLATGTYMPVSGLTKEFPVDGVSASACCVGIQLPMSMYPGNNHKLRLGAYIRTQDNHRRMSLFLWLVHCRAFRRLLRAFTSGAFRNTSDRTHYRRTLVLRIV